MAESVTTNCHWCSGSITGSGDTMEDALESARTNRDYHEDNCLVRIRKERAN